MIQLLINMAQMQANLDPTAAALIKSVTVTADGSLMKIQASLPQEVLQQLLQQAHNKPGTHGMGMGVQPRRR